MARNVTLSADEDLLRRARDRAQRNNTTLNALFRTWLQRYVGQERAGERYDAVMARLSHVEAGGSFSRDELNER